MKKKEKKEKKVIIEELTNEDLGKILAQETMSITQMWMDTNKKELIDRQYWLMFHLGFIAGLKVLGKSNVDVDIILLTAQKELSIFDDETLQGEIVDE